MMLSVFQVLFALLFPSVERNQEVFFVVFCTGYFTIDECTFTDNESKGPGGAVTLDQETGFTRFKIEKSVFTRSALTWPGLVRHFPAT